MTAATEETDNAGPLSDAIAFATAYLPALRDMEQRIDSGRSIGPSFRNQNALKAMIALLEHPELALTRAARGVENKP